MTEILLQAADLMERSGSISALSGLSMIGFAILFVFGILNCILGYRLLRFWMMLFGFVIGAGIGFGMAYSGGVTEKYMYAVIMVGAGAALAIIAFISYKVGIFILGAGIGIGISIYVLRPTTSLVFFFCLLIGIAIGVLASRHAREILIIGTSLLGGTAAGVSAAKLGGLAEIPYALGLAAGFILLGTLIQFATNPQYDEEEDMEEIHEEIPEESADYVDPRDYIPGRAERRKTSRRRSETIQPDIDMIAPELEKTVEYRPKRKIEKDLDIPLETYYQEEYARNRRNNEKQRYQERIVINEEELEEEVLREMMNEDRPVGEEFWKNISRRDQSRKNKSSNKSKDRRQR